MKNDFTLIPGLKSILDGLFACYNVTSGIFSFRDPDYSSTSGGFHPVEIMIRNGQLVYVTDFSFAGMPPYEELAKELDWDFGCQTWEHMGVEYPIQTGLELWVIWQRNFETYYRDGVFTVTYSEL